MCVSSGAQAITGLSGARFAIPQVKFHCGDLTVISQQNTTSVSAFETFAAELSRLMEGNVLMTCLLLLNVLSKHLHAYELRPRSRGHIAAL